MKKIVVMLTIFMLFVNIFPYSCIAEINLSQEQDILVLTSLNVLPEDFFERNEITRADILEIFVSIVHRDTAITDQSDAYYLKEKFSDFDNYNEHEIAYLKIGYGTGLFKGKMDVQGNLSASLNEVATWREAVIMAIRSLGAEDFLDNNRLNDDTYIVQMARNIGLEIYCINADGSKEAICGEMLDEKINPYEFCNFVNVFLHTPVLVTAYGGPYYKYYIDEIYLQNMGCTN